MIYISEKAMPIRIEEWAVVRGKREQKTAYVARNENLVGWGLSPQEAIEAAKRKGPI